MPEDDLSDDLTIHTPGDGPVDSQPAAAPAPARGKKGAAAPAPALDTSADSPELVALKTENAQLRATVEMLNEQLMDVADGQAAAQRPAEPKEPRLIGENWSSMTAAQAHAKGCTQRVLCMDGYYIPG